MPRAALLALAGGAALAACNGLVGNDSVSQWNPDGGYRDVTVGDGSGSGSSSGGGDASEGGDSTVVDSAAETNSGGDTGSSSGMDATSDATDAGTGCVIGGTPYAKGAVNPTTACETCQPSISASTWSDLTDGTGCGTGGICHTGACVSGCEIGGVYYAANAADPNNPCQTCQPATSTAAWSRIADGTACGNGQLCASGSCGTQCDIGGTLYASGAPNPINTCQSCQPGTSTSAWTSVANGTTCGAGVICNAASCSPGCYVGGTFYASAAANPTNACQSCQPGTSTSAWSTVANGTTCGAGVICNAASCSPGCYIGGTFYASAAANPTNACQTCQPGTSTSAWSTVADGTTCGPGDICNAASCSPGCYIGGTFYASAAANPTNACQSCQPGTSTSMWSSLANGTTCGTGHECSGGSCIVSPVDAGGDGGCGNVLGNDATNCGACGRSCNGTSCSGGVCGLVTISPSETNGGVLAADSTYAYWPSGDTGGGIERSTLSTSGGFAAIVTPISGATGFTLNSSTMYWTNAPSQQVFYAPKAGGTQMVLATSGWPASVAASGTYVYWADWTGGSAPIWRTPTTATGGPGEELTSATGGLPSSIMVDTSFVYWLGWADSCSSKSVVRKMPLTGVPDGGTPTTLVQDFLAPSLPFIGMSILGLDASYVYFPKCDGSIWRASNVDGSGLVQVASGQFKPGAIITDGVHVYWETSDGKIVRAAIDGSGLLVLADLGWGTSPSNAFQGLALSAGGWVIWDVSGSQGSVQMVAK